MSDCVLVVQIWKVGRKSAGPQLPSAPASRHGNPMSPVDKHHHSRAPPTSAPSRGPPVYEASPSPGNGIPPRGVSPSRGSRPRNGDANLKSGTMYRQPCVYCYNNRLACRVARQQPEAGCEECVRHNIECLMEPPSDGYHAPADRKPGVHSPPAHMSGATYPHASTPLSPGGSSAGSKRKPMEEHNGSNKSKRTTYSRSKKPGETTPPPSAQSTLPPMHHIQHVPAPPPANYPTSAAAPSTNSGRSSVVDARANQDLRRHQEMLVKQQQDAERESQRVLAGGLPTPYA
ncbi:hypothetical protein OPQ81_001943 [Rhizoctonia solani]|nr:hypothetical protein OPQ81_001943 [Rhizoctonia solani]